jgi:CRP/FNR family transcriptional regulator
MSHRSAADPTDIADFLGLTIETVSRQLTKLRRDKVILIVNYRHLIIDDFARLRARCD